MEIQLAQDDRAGRLEAPHDVRIFGRHALPEHVARRRRADAGRVDVVLQRDRNPVQRAAEFPVPLLRFHLPRGGERPIGGHRDERVQRRVEPADALPAEIREVDGRERALANQLRRRPENFCGSSGRSS
jgi:hypothetical protein